MRSSATTVLVLVLGVACLAAPLPAAADTTAVQVDRTRTHLAVRATIEADASQALCYAVIADFDRLAEFIPGLRESRIVSAPGEPLRLRQVGATKLGFRQYRLDVTLALEADPPRQIRFTRVAGNLEVMDGRWQVGGDARRCTVDYEAALRPEFWVPPLVGPLLVRRQVQQQIDGLAAEIGRRARGP